MIDGDKRGGNNKTNRICHYVISKYSTSIFDISQVDDICSGHWATLDSISTLLERVKLLIFNFVGVANIFHSDRLICSRNEHACQ